VTIRSIDRPIRFWVRLVVSYGVAAAGLFWALHDVRLREVVQAIERTDWLWLVPAVFTTLLVYLCAAWEWRILLQPVGNVPVKRTLQAVLVGRFANDVLPVHVGYVFRVFLVARWMGVGIAAIVPSLLIERLLDGVPLAIGIGVTALSVPLPRAIAGVAEFWAAIIVFGCGMLGLLLWWRPGVARRVAALLPDWRWVRKLRDVAQQLVNELRKIANSWVFLQAFALTLLKFLVQGMAYFCLFRSFRLRLDLRAEAAVFLISFVGMSMPSTPASVGVFQLFTISGLRLFGIPKVVASAFALLGFVVLTVPLSIAGFVALAQSGLSLAQLRRDAAERR
jgi:uncharacterized protein (TIRG00374 family)